MKYVIAINTGKGFITHADQEPNAIRYCGAEIYAVHSNHDYWISRVNGTEISRTQAEELVLAEMQSNWDSQQSAPLLPGESEERRQSRLGPRPESLTLPD
jgi:hypothetical protein